MATKRFSNKRKRHAARQARFKAGGRKHPLKGMQSRSAGQGSWPPNQDQRKHPDEVYGDTEIPFRKP